jgi:hypothetical protein
MAHAAIAACAAVMTSLFGEKIESLFPSTRKLLESSSVAQHLDGTAAWRGACVSP